MKAITLRVISVFVALVIGAALYTATLTRIQYTATFTVTPDDRAYTETELATIRGGAQTAFSLNRLSGTVNQCL
jgi:uncharacterized protein involved in exopolysaccharide biosynthesis